MAERWCKEHNKEWKLTKRGNYAHPLLKNGELAGFCNMPEGDAPPIVKAAVNAGAEVVGVTKKVETKYKADPTKTASIEKQVSLKGAIELCIHDKIELKDIGLYAKKFAKYLDTGD